MIGPSGTTQILVATKPVDFRKQADSLAALVQEALGADPFSGTVYVFRAKRASFTSFNIPIAVRGDRVSLASVAREATSPRSAHGASRT
jgi:transposase